MRKSFWSTPVKELIVVKESVIKTTASKSKTVEIIKRTTETYIEFSCGHRKRKTDFPKGLSATRFKCYYCAHMHKMAQISN